ncbi:MAG: cytochrome c oxidase subunit II [Bacteroidales bacterium]|nr:cytochrome c oxidase subunit II [Bacteroidales bacterium]
MNQDASNFVQGVDTAFVVILGICLFFLIGITVVMIYFVVKYHKKRHPKPVDVKDNLTLEITWTVIPTLLVLVMFWYGWLGYEPMRKVPEGALTIKATGQMWAWIFEYENGKVSDNLVVPIGKPVKLNLSSPDVLHSLYIPAFRIKEDVVPGLNNYMWFRSDKLGEYDILCAEYCGVRHSYMLSKVIVKPVDEYLEWYNAPADTTKKALPVGLQVLQRNGCVTCHSTDGSKIVGPSFKGLFGNTSLVVNESGDKIKMTVDETYIRRSIYEPNTDLVDGYNKGLMVSYKDRVNEEEIKEIVKYLKTLK